MDPGPHYAEQGDKILMDKHLLIIEDDDLLREQLARSLESHPYNLHLSATRDECLAQLAHLPSLFGALVDLNLGDKNGLELIAPLLRHSPQCRIVILTGYGSIPTAVTAMRRGAWNYLTKPASIGEILTALDNPPESLPELPDSPPSLERLEWEHIQQVLKEHDGNISAASRTLGIHRRTLQRRLKKRPAASEYNRDRPY